MAGAESLWSESMVVEMKSSVQDFVKHVSALERERGGSGIDREFRVVDDFEFKKWTENIFTSEVGEKNMDKNVYSNIMPYDHNRIQLTKIEGHPRSDYINASFIQGVKGTSGYIASQGPLESTVDDFWRMIWEKEIETMFMACPTEGYGRCKTYWNDVGKTHRYGDINVFTKSEEEISPDFVKRVFTVTRGKEVKRSVVQCHYSGWPDHGLPNDVGHVTEMIAAMRQTRRSGGPPTLIHCKGGVGRTGTLITIDYVWSLLDEGKLDEKFSLCDLLCKFREQRMWIVENPDQYAFVYRVVKALCENWLSKVASQAHKS